MPPAALDPFQLTLHLAGHCSVVAQPNYFKPSGIKAAGSGSVTHTAV